MEKKYTEVYDLSVLMSQGDMNIGRVASATTKMSAGEYFDMLSELIDHSPMFSEDLNKLISRDGDRSTYKNLVNMFNMLVNLGYEKHAVDFGGVQDAYDRGQTRIAATYAHNIMNDFNMLCSRIQSAKRVESSEVPGSNPYTISLRDWLKNLKKAKPAHKPLIIAVDDSLVILKSVSSLLGDEYRVHMLAKPYMLEKTLNQITPDLFLLDFNMPGINGFELIPIIRNFAEHKNTPIIFLTSEGTVDNLAGAIKLGACDFIVKPVKPQVLREKIAKHIAS